MAQIQEITESMTDKLVIDERPKQADATAPVSAPAVAGPDLPPAMEMVRGKSADEILADLNKSPLFMTEMEENDDIAALQALAYEGTPLENAQDFKERGNEYFREKQWTDAREYYTKGVTLLVAEDRRRARGEPPAPVKGPEEEDGKGVEREDPDSPEQLKVHREVLGQLYTNRAACQLNLRNYRSCTLDCGSALRLDAGNIKAWFRSARALLTLDKTDEAAEACAGGLAAAATKTTGKPQDTRALQQLTAEIAARAAVVQERKEREAEREATAARKVARVRAALWARKIRTRQTDKPPQTEDAVIALVQPDDDGAATTDVSESTLVFPTVLLYPRTLQSDFIKAFHEAETLADHLAYVLPPPWDDGRLYANTAAVDCFMDTVTGGLLKVGKKVVLGKILSQAAVEVVDGIVRMYIVPRSEADAWVQEHKSKKAAERGESSA